MGKEMKLPILVVGLSQAGKSEFILSFMDKELRQYYDSSDEGQTTRCSVVYEIRNKMFEQDKISTQIRIKTRDEFVREKIDVLQEKLPKEKSEFTNSRKRKTLRKVLIDNEKFFSYKEFKCKDEVSQKYDECFDDCFYDGLLLSEESGKGIKISADIYNRIAEKCDEEKRQTNPTDVLDVYKIFLNWLYKKCKEEVQNWFENKDMWKRVETEECGVEYRNETRKLDDVNLFLKVISKEKEKSSYSSMVAGIHISVPVAEYYQEMFEELDISSLIFIDTYGLDHAENGSSNVIEGRYITLLREEHPEIENILYIRNGTNNVGTDLEQNIPLLYKVKPNVLPYIAFTKIDSPEFVKHKKVINNMRSTDSDVYDSIYEILTDKNGLNLMEVYAELRIRALAENVVEYCSVVGKDKKAEEEYMSTNIEGLKKLLHTIIKKEYLGQEFFKMQDLKIEKMQDILDVRKVLALCKEEVWESDERPSQVPGRTKGALGNRLQNGELGFYSYYRGRVGYWYDCIYGGLKRRFTRKDELELEKKLSDWGESLGTLQKKIDGFIDKLMECSQCTHYAGNGWICKGCGRKEYCMQHLLYEAKRDIISKRVYSKDKGEWLRGVYDFAELLNDSQLIEKLQIIVDKVYVDYFLESCRNHNAYVLAKTFGKSEERTEQCLENMLDEYFEKYDSELEDDEKVLFEQKVNQEI